MQFESYATRQTTHRTSILGLMYANQYEYPQDRVRLDTATDGPLQNNEIANHIMDLCDCI